MNVMIDTNIIIDALNQREPWRIAAENIILLAATKKITAFITTSSITDIYYIIRKHRKNKQEARDAIVSLSKLMEFVTVDKSDCLKAVDSNMDDFEDALVSVCAAKVKAKYIVTRNAKDFSVSNVPPIDPDIFLQQF